jgi:hypothetical protein
MLEKAPAAGADIVMLDLEAREQRAPGSIPVLAGVGEERVH